MSRRYSYTKEQLSNAILISTSLAQTMKHLGIIPAGGNYKSIKKLIATHNIDTSHFTGQSWASGKTFPNKRPLEYYLSNNYSIHSHYLRLRLLKEGVFEHICSSCKNTKWLDNQIPLELDHIDGNHKNNMLSNLRLLCPNCHAFTPTYRSKKRKNS